MLIIGGESIVTFSVHIGPLGLNILETLQIHKEINTRLMSTYIAAYISYLLPSHNKIEDLSFSLIGREHHGFEFF